MTQREHDRKINVAVVQAGTVHSQMGNPGPEANFELLAGLAREAATTRPDLIVFPEYAVSGWPYPPEDEINALAEPVPGDGLWFRAYAELAQELATPIVGWLLEQEGDRRYNAAVLFDREGEFAGTYRKVQANLGEQTWWGWSQGEEFVVLELEGVRYGFSICSDMWFPETVRVNELLGADVVIHISIADDMGHLVPARAVDSGVPIVMAIFNGGSYAVDATGEVLHKLPAEPSGWHTFELYPFRVRTAQKYGGRWIPKRGLQNLRNLEAYAPLVDAATRPDWTEVFLDDAGSSQSRDELLARFGGRYDAHDAAPYRTPVVAFDPPWTSPYRVDPTHPHHLVNAEGAHLFIVNKTAWAYFGCEYPESVLERARAQGVNVLRVALEGAPYYDDLGIDLWPWQGTRDEPDWSSFDDGYWGEVERRIRVAGEQGIGLDLVLYMKLHPNGDGVAQQQPYWEKVLRRLSRYANILTWEIANEYTKNEAFQDAAGAYFAARDPYHRPICTSAGTTDDAVWPQKPWMGLAINHTCTSSTDRHPLDRWYLAVARNTRAHGKPAFCNESGREVRHGNDDGVHRRKQGWLWCAAGDFWTWHSWDGCEGIDETDYQAPGARYLRPMADFFRSLPFWRLAPNHTTLTPAPEVVSEDLIRSVLATPDRATVAGYLCTPTSGTQVEAQKLRLRLPDGTYRVRFVRPADLEEMATEIVTAEGRGATTMLTTPTFTDDLVIHLERVATVEETAMPGTG